MGCYSASLCCSITWLFRTAARLFVTISLLPVSMDASGYNMLAERFIDTRRSIQVLATDQVMQYFFDRQQRSSSSSGGLLWFKHCFLQQWGDEHLLSASFSELKVPDSVFVLPLPYSHALFCAARKAGSDSFRIDTISKFREIFQLAFNNVMKQLQYLFQ